MTKVVVAGREFRRRISCSGATALVLDLRVVGACLGVVCTHLPVAIADCLLDRSVVAAGLAVVLVDRNAPVRREQQPPPIDQIADLVESSKHDEQPKPLGHAFVGLREGELFELRRSDIDASACTITVGRKIEKDADLGAAGACHECGRVIGPPKTKSGKRRVHLPPEFQALLRAHLIAHTAPGADGLLFPAPAGTT